MKQHGTEVLSMLYTEFKLDDALAVRYEEGREEGINEGLTEGIAEGRADEKLQIARNLLAEGSTPDFVQKITGLSIEEIGKLQG
jgi:predicted transposase/invertase (TIGR01784 family)